MRLNLKKLSIATIAVLMISANHSQAQSVLDKLVPSIQAAPMVASPMVASPMVASPMVAAPMIATASSPMMAAPNYGTPSFAQTAPRFASNGPLTVGPYPQACGNCNMKQVPTEVPCLKPVTSCCGQLGRLGVPSLTTPLRTDIPPIGRANGRPLLGRWNSF